METFGAVGLTVIFVSGFICFVRIIRAILDHLAEARRLTLAPGKCECDHNRCSHKSGRKACTSMTMDRNGNIGPCACTCYIAAAPTPDQVFAKGCGIALW